MNNPLTKSIRGNSLSSIWTHWTSCLFVYTIIATVVKWGVLSRQVEACTKVRPTSYRNCRFIPLLLFLHWPVGEPSTPALLSTLVLQNFYDRESLMHVLAWHQNVCAQSGFPKISHKGCETLLVNISVLMGVSSVWKIHWGNYSCIHVTEIMNISGPETAKQKLYF